MKIRFRDDASHIAELKRKGENAVDWGYTQEQFDKTPAAEPGDIWKISWSTGLFAGYAIACPQCTETHYWTTALNCSSRDANGVCAHSGNGSCWIWTGSAEDGTLTASPSLYSVKEKGGCGWHGWLQNGDLHL